MEPETRWSGRRCPQCQAELLTDGEFDVCSLVGCDYGVLVEVRTPQVKCWEDGGGSTCLLPDGHDGEHVFTPDSDITVRFS